MHSDAGDECLQLLLSPSLSAPSAGALFISGHDDTSLGCSLGPEIVSLFSFVSWKTDGSRRVSFIIAFLMGKVLLALTWLWMPGCRIPGRTSTLILESEVPWRAMQP